MASVKNGWLLGVLVLAACPADDASGDGTDSDGTDGSTGAPTTSATSPTTAPASTSSTTTDPSTSTTDETMGSSSGEESSSTGPMLPGVCVGFDIVGALGEVASLDGAMIETTCDATPAGCGGDIVGTWTVESTCGWESTPNVFEDTCPGSTMTVNSGSLTGTRTFNADMTFAFDTVTVLDFDVNLDAMMCFMVDCAGLQTALVAQMLDATCADAGDGTCDCAITATTPSMATGTWATADNALVLTTMDGEAGLEYCVTGERLDLWTPINDPMIYEEQCADEMDCADALGNLSEFYACVLP